jgi:small subunit ribosomal protein S18
MSNTGSNRYGSDSRSSGPSGGRRNDDGPRGRGGDKDDNDMPWRRRGRRRVCRYCADKDLAIDYKDPQALRYFVTERGKIVPRRISGSCAKHQRAITTAIKRARIIALLPFTMAD